MIRIPDMVSSGTSKFGSDFTLRAWQLNPQRRHLSDCMG
jgi:hypothetical protein